MSVTGTGQDLVHNDFQEQTQSKRSDEVPLHRPAPPVRLQNLVTVTGNAGVDNGGVWGFPIGLVGRFLTGAWVKKQYLASSRVV